MSGYALWTEYEDSKLLTLRSQGLSYNQIEEEFMLDDKCYERTTVALRKRISVKCKFMCEDEACSSSESEDENTLPFLNVSDRTEEQQKEYEEDLKISVEQILASKKNGEFSTVEELAKLLTTCTGDVFTSLQTLIEDGFPVRIYDNGKIYYDKRYEVADYYLKPKEIELHNPNHFCFGVVSDTHFGSTECRIAELVACYNEFKKRGVRDVFHAGDISDGWRVYGPKQDQQQSAIGAEDQADLIVRTYPKIAGIDTWFINGNHDKSFKDRAYVNFASMITSQRDDMHYLGDYNVLVKYGWWKMRIHHARYNPAYALTYHLQKFMEKRNDRDLNCYVVGHFHSAVPLFNYAGVNIGLTGGAFQGPTELVREKGFACSIGGWCIHVNRLAGGGLSVLPEWIGYSL